MHKLTVLRGYRPVGIHLLQLSMPTVQRFLMWRSHVVTWMKLSCADYIHSIWSLMDTYLFFQSYFLRIVIRPLTDCSLVIITGVLYCIVDTLVTWYEVANLFPFCNLGLLWEILEIPPAKGILFFFVEQPCSAILIVFVNSLVNSKNVL